MTGHVPGGLTVFSVDTLDDALAALEVIADGGDTSELPTCPAGCSRGPSSHSGSIEWKPVPPESTDSKATGAS